MGYDSPSYPNKTDPKFAQIYNPYNVGVIRTERNAALPKQIKGNKGEIEIVGGAVLGNMERSTDAGKLVSILFNIIPPSNGRVRDSPKTWVVNRRCTPNGNGNYI